MPSEPSPRLQLAIHAARRAGRLTLKYFQSGDLGVDRKADDSPVTRADREAEALIREEIEAGFPDDAILGEEAGETAGASGWRWILDPIDGTKSFIHGVPLYGTLVGVERDGEARIGVIVLPALGEYLYAERGGGAWWVRGSGDPERARVSTTPTLGEALVCHTSLKGFLQTGRGPVPRRLQDRARLVRGWGDCYGYALVATGRADAMIDPIMNVWDCAALQPVVEEAGGSFTDWSGVPTIHGGEAVASNGYVTAELLELLKA